MSRMIILGLVLLAFTLRIVGITDHPAGFTPDEASFGYDAYSLLKTGKDQWGNRFPTSFKSFGDYKLPVYTYLTVPSVALFGLNELSVRLPNALLGSFAVVVTYLLATELIYDKKEIDKKLPYLAALFLAVSYWHIALSRGAFEANLTTFFMTAGAWLFLKARRHQQLLSASMLFFGLNLFTYHSARLVTPLIVVVLLYLYRHAFPMRKHYTLASAVFLLFFVGSLLSLLAGSGIRAATSTIVSQNLGSGIIRASVVNAGMPLSFARLVYNEPMAKLWKFTQNYISYFSTGFLFTEGAREATYGMVPGVGLLSIVECFGLLLFVWFLFSKKEKSGLFLMFWILLAPIPAAISVGPGNAANRAAILMPALEIAAAFGIFFGISRLHNRFKKTAISVAFSLSLILGLFSFVRYMYEQPIYAQNGMMYGMSELFSFLKEYPTKHIILSRSLSEPHIFAAFYGPIHPPLFQKATEYWDFEDQGLNWVDQQEGYFVDRYKIISIDPVRDFYLENTFIVGTPLEIPKKARIVKSILSPDKKVLWVVAEKP